MGTVGELHDGDSEELVFIFTYVHICMYRDPEEVVLRI